MKPKSARRSKAGAARALTPRTMLLIHGAFVGGWCWGPFDRYFTARGWRCLAPDLRHHQPGADLDALGGTSLNDYVADLEALIRTLPHPPVLVGHSMGGLICQKLAAKGLAEAVVLLAPSSPWGILPSHQTEIEARLGLMSIPGFWARAIQPSRHVANDRALDRLPPDLQAAAFLGFVPESGRALFEILFWELDLSHASAVTIRDIPCPVLLTVGDQDKVISPASVRALARKFHSGAHFHMLEGHSHFLFGEPGFEKLTALCENWLKHALEPDAFGSFRPKG